MEHCCTGCGQVGWTEQRLMVSAMFPGGVPTDREHSIVFPILLYKVNSIFCVLMYVLCILYSLLSRPTNA